MAFENFHVVIQNLDVHIYIVKWTESSIFLSVCCLMKYRGYRY